MGQQQLLLVILVTIIVGIATVVAINTFGAAASSATVDAVRQDLATIGASAQGFYMKPKMLGGGGRTFNEGGANDGGITWGDIAFGGTVNATGDMENENGIYVMSGKTAGDFIVTATAFTTDSTTIAARICPDNIIMGQEDEAATALAAC